MMYGHLFELVAGILEFLDHLEANCAGVGLKFNMIKEIAANKAKVAVYIAGLETKGKFDKIMVNAPNNFPT